MYSIYVEKEDDPFQMATLQNVLAPIANIYVIMPYRRLEYCSFSAV